MPMALLCILFLASLAHATAPPILNRPLASQLFPANTAISSVFLIPPSSALIANLSTTLHALRVPPSWSFSIGFSGATFLPATHGPQTLSFRAQLDNGDALPEWLNFAKDTITFGGVAPKQAYGIQVLNIVVSASSTSSSSVSDTFTLIVAPHDLSLTGPLLTRNATGDNKFSAVLNDWQGVQVDGARVKASSLPTSSNSARDVDWDSTPDANDASPPLSLALDTSSFSWLAYDPASRTLSGTPPASLASAPGPVIPALVTLAYLPQPLTVSTNLTLSILPSMFKTQSLPRLDSSPGSSISFALAPYLSTSAPANLSVTASWDQQNATWLTFDSVARQLSGGVPKDATSNVNVAFISRDASTGTISRANLLISIDGARNAPIKSPTDRALRKAGKKVSVAVGIVLGVVASIVILACFLAFCRRCCAAQEHVDGPYVIDQSALDDSLKSTSGHKSNLEKDESAATSGVDTVYLSSPKLPYVSFAGAHHANPGRMITKGAFFNAIRERFGSDGSWRARRGANGSGSGKRARKSKISKPMAILSSSTSIRDGFGDRGRRGLGDTTGDNFTIFGRGSSAGHATHTTAIAPNSGPANASNTPPPQRPPRADLSLSLGGTNAPPSAGSSAGTAVLAYERSRSNSDPSARNSTSANGNGVSRKSGSAPSLGVGSVGTQTGTGSGTQSTFASGDSSRLTNAAGEVPFRRPDFNGHFETLAERSIREMTSPGPTIPARAMVGARTKAADTSPPKPPPKTPSPAKISPPKAPSQSASNASNKSGNALKSGTANSSPGVGLSAQSSDPMTSAQNATSKPGSQASLGMPSSYRNVFFGGEDNESDSSTEDAEIAVIRQAVKRSSSDTQTKPVKARMKQGPAGKPRLVQFTHARTPAASGQAQMRDISQRAVVKGTESEDPEAEMRIGLEYVRQLGHSPPGASQNAHSSGIASSHPSIASDATRTPLAEFYASNDSNGSIAGRTRVLAPLVISSHRARHQAAYSMESDAHDSFVSAIERETDVERGSRWMVEATLPHHTVYAACPFRFAADLDPATKHASALAASALEARQADGRALPEWLRFDPSRRQFWGVGPKATKGEKGQTLIGRVVVKVWQVEKGQLVGGTVFDVLAEDV